MKKLYIHRAIDLENIAYSDNIYKTKKEALKNINTIKKTNDYTDLLIEIIIEQETFNTPFQIIKNELKYINIFQETLNFIKNAKIIYKK